ncbi:hypothetical protein [Nannocystis pusilla]|uniref:hypothetical protein n=1 Tax=Nannocystis pusilla TaxID=889268 RepID=UPI003DA369E7
MSSQAIRSSGRLRRRRPNVADEQLRGLLKLLELHRTLPKLAESGDKVALATELERATHEHPEMVEPAFWHTRLRCEQLLEQYQQLVVLDAKIQVFLAPDVGPEGSAAFSWYRKVIGNRRALRKVQETWNACFDAALSALLELAERSSDRWAIDLTRHELAGRRAALALIVHQTMPQLRKRSNRDKAVQSLQACLGPMLELHEARPEHPEPCLWLTRFHVLLGDRVEARRWARLAEQRGDARGLEVLDTETTAKK